MRYVDTRALSAITSGCYEQTSDQVSEALGETASLIATFKNRVLFERDGEILQASWKRTDDTIVISSEVKAGIDVCEGDEVRFLVTPTILEAVDQIMNGEPCKVGQIVGLVDSDQMYFASEFINLSDASVVDQPWKIFYEENRDHVRKTVHGKLGATEAQVPSRRFSKVRDRLDKFSTEMRETTDVVCELASTILKNVESNGSSVDEGLQRSVYEEAQTMIESLTGLQKTCEKVHLPEFARVLDRSCSRMRDILVMSEFLSIES